LVKGIINIDFLKIISIKNDYLTIMARTKLTARSSTGGKAPRRHLATRYVSMDDASFVKPPSIQQQIDSLINDSLPYLGDDMLYVKYTRPTPTLPFSETVGIDTNL
jgi:hypothetical protein